MVWWVGQKKYVYVLDTYINVYSSIIIGNNLLSSLIYV